MSLNDCVPENDCEERTPITAPGELTPRTFNNEEPDPENPKIPILLPSLEIGSNPPEFDIVFASATILIVFDIPLKSVSSESILTRSFKTIDAGIGPLFHVSFGVLTQNL